MYTNKIIIYLAADLKTGKVYRGEPEKGVKVDTTLTISDSDMIDLVSNSKIHCIYLL